MLGVAPTASKSPAVMRDDLPPPVVVRTFAGLLVFQVLSDAVGFTDGSPRPDMPLSIRNDVD